ncbi:MAG: hypothetical protein WA056_06680 [Gallionella sp.]
MFEGISSFIGANQALWWALGILTGIVALYQASQSFWFLDLFMRLPWVGSIARWSKDTEKGSNGWLKREAQLCAVYKYFVTIISESKFNERIEYMRNAGDLGRTPMPASIKALLFVLVVCEGLGFSYILGTWMARDGSANTHTLLMFAIVFVIAVILVWVTHAAGHQYYRTTLLRSCFKRYKEKEGSEYSSMSVALMNDQSIDANQSDYTRCINRVAKDSHDKGSYAWSWVAAVAILVIFTLSTVMRWENLQGELTRETRNQSQTTNGSSTNPFAGLELPDSVTESQQAADKKLDEEVTASTKAEGLAAILMLGFIFVVTQIVGFGAGYKYGFVGRETYKNANGANSLWFWSKKDGAFADTGGFSTYDSYWSTFEPLLDLVGERLRELQHRLQQNAHENIRLDKTFLTYLEEHQANSSSTRAKLDRTSPPRMVVEPAAQVGQPSAVNSISPVDKAKNDISAMTDRDEQIRYYNGLPSEVKAELKPWLKQRKEDAERKAKEQEQAEELF